MCTFILAMEILHSRIRLLLLFFIFVRSYFESPLREHALKVMKTLFPQRNLLVPMISVRLYLKFVLI
jgi:hypothetical protein